MQLEDYTTGTVSITNGSTALTGTGTAWSVAGFKAGDTFHAQGLVGIVASVVSDTSITLRDAWTGTTISGGDYLLRYQPDNSRMQGTTRQLLDELRQGIWLTPDATGKTADKADYDDRPKGFRFLDVSVDPFKLYVKESDTSGDWSSGADWVGPAGDAGPAGADGDITWEGAWVTATAYTANQAVSEGGSSYVCVTNHTSGTFATDLSAGKWELMAQKGDTGATGATGAPGTNGTDGADGVVQSIVAGTGIAVNGADPANPVVSTVKEVLAANRTYYVRKTGSDTNDGLSSSAAFLTIQKAINVALALDMSIYSVTIDVGAGTFNEGSRLGVTGNGNARITVQGAGYDHTTISGSSYGTSANGGVNLTVRDVDVIGDQICITAGSGAVVSLAGTVQISGGAARLLQAVYSGQISIAGTVTVLINADSTYLLYAESGGYMNIAAGVTMKTTGARSFVATVLSSGSSNVSVTASQVTWDTTDGAISGSRYQAKLNGVINTVTGGGATYFPGSTDGTTATGGQYV